MFGQLAKTFLRVVFRRLPFPLYGSKVLKIRRSAYQVPALVPQGFFSQKGQDFRVSEILGRTEGGTFVDVGAFDGVTGSNTLFFERELGWSGLCVEPHPDAFEELATHRTSICINVAISKERRYVPFVALSGPSAQLSGVDGRVKTQEVERAVQTKGAEKSLLRVPSRRLDDLLVENGIARVDYLSVDIEGSELEALETLDFDAVWIEVISVENSRTDDLIGRFLRRKGFSLEMTIGREEEIYRNRSRAPVERSLA